MKVLKIIGIIVLVLRVAVVIMGLVAPKEYTVVIDAPRPLVFNHIKYWRDWAAWSPWSEMDSTMKVTIIGTDGEAGSVYEWVGDSKKTGKGEMKMTDIKDLDRIDFSLHFIEPWESNADGYFNVSGSDDRTTVLWGMKAKTPFPWNIMYLFMNMDSMLGPDFERGLGKLKQISEKEAKAVLSYQVQKVPFPSTNYAAIRKETSFNNMESFFKDSYSTIQKAISTSRARMVGPPVGLFFSWDKHEMKGDVAAAIPTNKAVNLGEVKNIKLPFATAYSVDYYGPYSGTAAAYMALDNYIKKNKLTFKWPVIEEYLTNPMSQPDSSKWLTKIYYFAE